MWDKLRQIWMIKDIRQKVLFVLGMLVIFRVAAHIPVPGINPENLQAFLSGNQILGLLNIFSGGTIENFSLVMLGVAPYITASIIFQWIRFLVPVLDLGSFSSLADFSLTIFYLFFGIRKTEVPA